jgi:hypothetical protein
MRETTMAYWLNARKGEWGLTGPTAAEAAEDLPKGKPDRNTVGRWVDRFLEVMEPKGTVCLVEDKEEFLYVYRCLERLSIPLSYSPVVPFDDDGAKPRSRGCSRKAA